MREEETYVVIEDFLTHFGAKGMRWGIRKERATDILTKTERQAAKKNMKESRNDLVTRMFDPKSGLGNKPYSELSTQSRTIKKGAEFYRITPRKDEKIRDITFVSTNQKDRNIYNAVMPSLSGRGGKKSYKLHYESTFMAIQALKLPSEKERIDAFSDLMNTKSIQINTIFGKKKNITGREYLKRTGYAREVKRLNDVDLGRRTFDSMTQMQHLSTPLSSAYFKSLRSKGFNAVQDDNDKNILSNDPVILLRPKSSTRPVSVKQLTNRDINDAQIAFDSKLD